MWSNSSIDDLVTFGFPFSLSGLFVWCLLLCLLACFLYSFFSFHSWIFCNWYFPRCRNRIIINSFVWWSLAMQSWGRLLTFILLTCWLENHLKVPVPTKMNRFPAWLLGGKEEVPAGNYYLWILGGIPKRLVRSGCRNSVFGCCLLWFLVSFTLFLHNCTLKFISH